MQGGLRHQAIDDEISDGHRHDEQRADDDRGRRGGNTESSAGEADRERKDKTQQRPHGSARKPKVCPLERTWSASTNPSVIATNRHAPIKRGGAGDGMSKYL